MKIGFMGIQIWAFYLVIGFISFSFTDSYFINDDLRGRENPSVIYSYDRIDEVKRACKLVVSSGSVLKPNGNRDYSIKTELSFVDGDWDQEDGKAPLLPFVERDLRQDVSARRLPLSLISFWVNDIDDHHKSTDSVNVNAVLYMGRAIDESFMQKPYDRSPHFHIWPSHSELSISFQGIYMETEEENGGERVMCLLGNGELPSRQTDDSSSDPWGWLKDSDLNYNQPPILQDDQILLILRYPQKLTLTNMAIRGEMRSLNPKSSLKYFDQVKISSQMGSSASYEFGSNEIVSKACDPYPVEDSLKNNEIDIYKGPVLCSFLQQLSQGEAFIIVPNWKCNSTKETYCNKLGPFGSSDKTINDTNGGFKDVKLSMQNVRCEKNSDGLIRVSAVFRVISPLENDYYGRQRTGLNKKMALPAEGIWRESSGQLCMVGCFADRCDTRICLYIPISFSIQQRSIIVGSFSSISNTIHSHFPLSFEKLVQPNELWDRAQTSHLHYKYSKIDLAGTILEKYEPFSFGSVIKSSLLKFPKLEDQESYMSSLSVLLEDLTLQVAGVPDSVPNSGRVIGTDVRMEIVSIGPLFGHYLSYQNGSIPEEDVPYHTKAEYTEKNLLLNVSAQLSLTGKLYKNNSLFFLEGIYDPHVGKLYTIGCRDVRASQEILFQSMDLENGLDCSIEVVISYPPTTSRWLVNPTARVSIISLRNEDDPLFFRPIKIQTLPIMYRRQREDIFSREGVEGILRILTLSLAIACILSQIVYIGTNADSVPFISLVMLGVQAIGYTLPLVTGAQALFKKMASEYGRTSYDLESNQWFHVIEYTVKFLILVSFLLTLRLCQKVWKSRTRLLARTPRDSYHFIPSDKKVLISTFALHLIGYLSVLAIHSMKRSKTSVGTTYMYSNQNSGKMWEWATELEEYLGLVQDFFLLPQIIGNFIWGIHCQPVRKVYFIGITLVRLLPHAYDYIQDPIPNPYFSEEYEFVDPNLDFFSKFGDIAIPVTAVLLAMIVYVQQRWSYEKLSETIKVGKFRLLPKGSKVYQRLPTNGFETELASSASEDTKREKERGEEE